MNELGLLVINMSGLIIVRRSVDESTLKSMELIRRSAGEALRIFDSEPILSVFIVVAV